jgi:hypothetical protein
MKTPIASNGYFKFASRLRNERIIAFLQNLALIAASRNSGIAFRWPGEKNDGLTRR